MSLLDTIATLSDADLQQLLAAIPPELERRKKARLDAVRAEIIRLANDNGLSESELGRLLGATGGGKPRKRAPSSKASQARYRNPSTGEVWSGRGKQPPWLKDAVAAGLTKEQFLVEAGAERPAAALPDLAFDAGLQNREG